MIEEDGCSSWALLLTDPLIDDIGSERKNHPLRRKPIDKCKGEGSGIATREDEATQDKGTRMHKDAVKGITSRCPAIYSLQEAHMYVWITCYIGNVICSRCTSSQKSLLTLLRSIAYSGWIIFGQARWRTSSLCAFYSLEWGITDAGAGRWHQRHWPRPGSVRRIPGHYGGQDAQCGRRRWSRNRRIFIHVLFLVRCIFSFIFIRVFD